MIAPTVSHVLFVSLLASFLPGAFSLSTAGLKQATRKDVVNRQQDRRAALVPRQSPAPCVPPIGTAPVDDESGNGLFYDLYYNGPGFTEAVNNPGNTNPIGSPPLTGPIANVPVPDAVRACLDFAAGNGYDSFDLSFLQSTCAYSCTAYLGPNMDSAQFDVANADVLQGYGYSTLAPP